MSSSVFISFTVAPGNIADPDFLLTPDLPDYPENHSNVSTVAHRVKSTSLLDSEVKCR